jgi:hypothetical protein
MTSSSDQIAQTGARLDRDDIGARHHDILDGQLVQLEDVAQDRALAALDDRALAFITLDKGFEAVAQGGLVDPAAPPEAPDPPQARPVRVVAVVRAPVLGPPLVFRSSFVGPTVAVPTHSVPSSALRAGA